MLMDSLLGGRNIPTTLQSLACVGQYSVLAYDNIYEDITSYIYQVFQVSDKRCYYGDIQLILCFLLTFLIVDGKIYRRNHRTIKCLVISLLVVATLAS